jgi:hypothetical protein
MIAWRSAIAWRMDMLFSFYAFFMSHSAGF